jgi:uncharacterized protein RhaS with RHS repeats
VKYDALNRPAEKRIPLEIDSSGNIVYSIERYGYDPAGNLIRKTLSGTKDKLDTREITYTYYPNNLLDTTTDSSGGYSKNYYDRNGNVAKTMTLRDDGEYDIREYEYDVMNRVTRDIRLADMEDI